MMKKLVIRVSLAAAITASMGVHGAVQAEETDLAYRGSLTAAWYEEPEGAEGYGGSEAFSNTAEEWKTAHPDISLEENIFTEEEYDQQIEALAGDSDLPDIFLLRDINTADWAEKGLVLDLTDHIKKSPYNNDYAGIFFTPFRADGKVYGYPAYTAGTGTVVIYDKGLWAEAGFDEFPGSWKDVLAAAEYFNGLGIDAIAFGNADLQQANRSFFSVLGNRYTGPDWFRSLIEKSGAAFTDSGFTKALEEMRYLFNESGIFNDDFGLITNEQAREFYITGNAAAYIGSSQDEAIIREALQEADPEKYENMGFASLPQPVNTAKAPTSQNMVLDYAVAVNPAVADDPDKLAAAVDFAQEVTGPAFASFAAENYALSGLTAPGEADLSAFDQITRDFFRWSYVDTEKCLTYDTCMDSNVCRTMNGDLQALMDGEMSPEEAAADLQAAIAPAETAEAQ